MKTKSILFAVIALVATTAFAQTTSKVAVINQKQAGTFKVIYEGASQGKVKMNIRNTSGETVFTEVINESNGFIRPVNFTGLEFGEYTIEIADGSNKLAQTVNYQPVAVAKNVHVAKINEEGKYLLAVANMGSEKINVRIFDGENNLVHNESVTVNGSLGLVYNLQKVSGAPTFEVTDNSGAVKTIKY
ncbi:MAG: hypothetical protein DI538_04705 [Azospira oryzae]|jgi:hypothetical protein|nr:MAG: hypothetical protein DI538_04705 [Azospira oryzae]